MITERGESMRRQTARKTKEAQSAVEPPIDYATIELLESWKRMDATDDPELVRAAEEELEEFMKAMNENRAATGERLIFP